MSAVPSNTPSENHLNEQVSRYVYAHLEDLDRASLGRKADPCSVQTYSNLMKAKKDQCCGVTARVSINCEARQVLGGLVTMMIEEIANSDVVEGDTIDIIRRKTIEANPETFTDFIIGTGEIFKQRFGATLTSASDPPKWFTGILESHIPHVGKSMILTAIISSGLDNFLKSIAWSIGQMLPYAKSPTVNQNFLLGLMAQLGMPLLMVDVLQSNIRKKPPTKPRAPKKAPAADATVDAVEKTATPQDSTEVSEAIGDL